MSQKRCVILLMTLMAFVSPVASAEDTSANHEIAERSSPGTEFVPKTDGIAVTNFGDFAFDGYCLGYSALYCMRRLPLNDVSSKLGPRIASWLDQSKSDSDGMTWLKIVRSLALLQTNQQYGETLNNLARPLPPSRRILPGRNKPLYDERPSKYDDDGDLNPAIGAKTMRGYYDWLQSPQGKKEGLLGTVNVVSVGTRSYDGGDEQVGGHALYLYRANLKNGVYTFYYLDPNHPREEASFTYDPAKNDTQFLKDPGKSLRFTLSGVVKPEALLTAYQAASQDIRSNKSIDSKALSAFLGLETVADKEVCVYSDCRITSQNYGQWTHSLAQVYPQSDIEKSGLFWESDPRYSRLYLMLGLAAQAQLDLGCENFGNFMNLALQDYVRSAKLATERIGRIKATFRPTAAKMTDKGCQ